MSITSHYSINSVFHINFLQTLAFLILFQLPGNLSDYSRCQATWKLFGTKMVCLWRIETRTNDSSLGFQPSLSQSLSSTYRFIDEPDLVFRLSSQIQSNLNKTCAVKGGRRKGGVVIESLWCFAQSNRARADDNIERERVSHGSRK